MTCILQNKKYFLWLDMSLFVLKNRSTIITCLIKFTLYVLNKTEIFCYFFKVD